MFKTVLFVTLLVGAAIADLNDFPDNDAFQLARKENGSFFEPPQELYQQIAIELEAIRNAVPVLAHIHYMPLLKDGKAICNKQIDLDQLNNSSLGPIMVEDIGNNEILITFTKPYSGVLLAPRIVDDFGKMGERVSCRSVRLVGPRTFISRAVTFKNDKILVRYTFHKQFGSLLRIDKEHIWGVKYLDGNVTLKYESE